MSVRRRGDVFVFALLLAAGSIAGSVYAAPLGTAFTYQGQLQQNGSPASGPCDFQFSLWDAAGSGSPPAGGTQLGSTQSVNTVTVTNGLFTVPLNGGAEFGATAFTGNDRWLQMAVRCPAGSGSFSAAFSPRQELTAAPYALYSAGAPWAGLTGVPAGFADGTDNDVLGGLSCTDGQIAKRSGSTWICGTIPTYTNGFGLSLSSNTFSVNTTVIQSRVTGTCAGNAISAVNADGSVTCGGGTVTAITAGTGLTGGTITTSGTIAANIGTTAGTVAAGNHDHLGQSWSGGVPTGLQVQSTTANGIGLFGVANSGATAHGVEGDSSAGVGVYGAATGTSGVNYGVFGRTASSSGWAGYFQGNVYINGSSGYLGINGGGNDTIEFLQGGISQFLLINDIGNFGQKNFSIYASAAAQNRFFIDPSGNVGIGDFRPAGLGNPSAKLHVVAPTGNGLLVQANGTTGTTSGIHGTTASFGVGVIGEATSAVCPNTAAGQAMAPNSRGRVGAPRAANAAGYGVGVFGQAASTCGIGVQGYASSSDAYASAVGVSGETVSPYGTGVEGAAAASGPGASGIGVFGNTLSPYGVGVDGYASNNDPSAAAYGVFGRADSPFGVGVYGVAGSSTGTNYGVVGACTSDAGAGVRAEGSSEIGTALEIGVGAIKVPGAGIGTHTTVFIHQATAANSTADYTVIDHPLTNGDPNAILIITPNWNPGGGISGVYNKHPVGVWYTGTRWAIFNQDIQPVPVNAAFNVLVVKP